MDTGRIADQERNSRRPVDGGVWRRNGAWDGVFAAVVIVALFALSFWMAAALPQALEIAASASNSAAARFIRPEPDEDHPYPRHIEEEQPELPLANDARIEGPMPA